MHLDHDVPIVLYTTLDLRSLALSYGLEANLMFLV